MVYVYSMDSRFLTLPFSLANSYPPATPVFYRALFCVAPALQLLMVWMWNKQYGYVTMFAVVLPLAPLLALIRCLAEIFIDHQKLLRCRRPPYIDRSVGHALRQRSLLIVFLCVF